MKIFRAAIAAVLMTPAIAAAECYYGMVFEKYECKTGIPAICGNWNHACSKCSNGTCAESVDVGVSAEGCKKHAVTSRTCLQCDDGAEFTYNNNGNNGCQCKNGYTATASDVNDLHPACKPCSEVAPVNHGKCASCRSSLCTAWTCDAGYVRTAQSDGFCKTCSEIPVENGKCTKCEAACTDDEQKTFGSPAQTYTRCSAPKCTAFSCNAGYRSDGTACVKECPVNCAECDSDGACLKCAAGYALKYGVCAVKQKQQVAFCPSDKTLSADGCCCVSK